MNQCGNERMANLALIGSVQDTPPQGLCTQLWFPLCVAVSLAMAEQLLHPPPAHTLEDHAEDKSQEEK